MREQRIGDAIARADLPYEEVAEEIDRFVGAMDSTAGRAQLLYEALEDTPPDGVEARLAAVRRDGGQPELEEALATQLATLRRMEKQLDKFFRRDGAVPRGTGHGALAARVGLGVLGVGRADGARRRRARACERVGASAEGMAAAFTQAGEPWTHLPATIVARSLGDVTFAELREVAAR